MEDSEIISLMAQKDFRGLEGLIDQYGAVICRTIAAILNLPTEASYKKEVENEAFYKIWENSGSFDPQKASLKTWCLTITRNLAVDKKRQALRNSRQVPSEVLPEKGVWQKPLSKDQFLDLVSVLSAEDQLIFLKFFFFQDKPAEIAEDLGLTSGIISNRLVRGKEKLRQVLAKEVAK